MRSCCAICHRTGRWFAAKIFQRRERGSCFIARACACRIAWRHQEHAGVAFEEPLFPREMLRHVPPAEHKPPPAIKRRPGLLTKPLTPAERLLVEQWACDSPHTLGG